VRERICERASLALELIDCMREIILRFGGPANRL
jgi:hypothetical protein